MIARAVPAILKTAEAAAHIGVKTSTLREWAVTKPEVRACKFSRGWWRTADLDRLMGVRK